MSTPRFDILLNLMPKIADAVNAFPQHLQETVYNAMVEAIHKDIEASASPGPSTRSGAVRLASTHYSGEKTPEWEQRTARNPAAPSGEE